MYPTIIYSLPLRVSVTSFMDAPLRIISFSIAGGGSGEKSPSSKSDQGVKKQDYIPQLELIKTEEEESLSSFDTLRKDPNLLIDPATPVFKAATRPKRSSPHSEPEATSSSYGRLSSPISKSKNKKMNFTKNNSSYSLNKGSKAKPPSKQQVSISPALVYHYCSLKLYHFERYLKFF